MNKFATSKTQIFETFKKDGRVNYLTKHLSQAAQVILEEAWQTAGLADFPNELSPCLVAVGGFGRNELFPYSDVDILVLLHFGLEDPKVSMYSKQLETFISLCWDY